ncbi:mitochondrial ribosomal protein subunit L20-domain-containing protein [Aspergillus taichungensis]|uniref:Mitochondrial ribosomal protein subunit L20-domain-containing protein n=1 Tax=Aspergillus taichungensis TaxID=482145 RepID=A0A2J5HLF0_9EURO|nr:mitochondrial ribosomal protein subunit L20-domain-containing protein [Aspergillus taichungensis]
MAACIVCPKRPLLALPFLLPSCEPVALELRRNQSSYRRTKQRLRVKPDASFGASNQSRDHIIYNPPPTAPSVYQTPTKFLPPDDARRALRTDASSGSENLDSFAPIYKSSPEKTYHLSPSDIEEIRKLRLTDPMSWSRWKLAKRFGCSPMFIAMVCEAAPEKKEMQKQVLEAIQSRWGAKRRMAREDRQLRRETWGRDE